MPFPRVVSRRKFLEGSAAGLAGAALCGKSVAAPLSGKPKPNVLLIAVDDLRTELGCYGSKIAKTPHIDRLAQSGVLFEHHYSHFAVCIPSRAALLTSLRPERTHQMYGPTVWDKVPGVSTWGNVFQGAGYATVSLGKVWHVIGEGSKPDRFDVDIPSEDENTYADLKNEKTFKDWQNGQKGKGGKKGEGQDSVAYAPIVEACDLPDDNYMDGALATRAIAQLKRLKAGDKPFMLAVGFHKPHIPYVAPKRYWNLYDRDKLPLSPQPNYPKDAPAIAWSSNPNFHNYSYGMLPPLPKGDAHTEVMPEPSAREIRHGYFACVSFVDAQVGRVLEALSNEGLDKNTIVVLWTDHGYHLGDLNQWGKQTNFETATHTPLIVRAPGQSATNRHCRSLVETVDVLPTLLDLCGMAPLEVTDGQSFARLLRQPDMPWKDAAFQVFNRGATVPSEGTPSPQSELVIGHAMRTSTHRYIEWRTGWSLSGKLLATELYDYSQGPYEARNLADDPAHAKLRSSLALRLADGPAKTPIS